MPALLSGPRACGYGRSVQHSTAWRAVSRSPWKFLTSPWPWRSFLYLLTGGVFGALVLVVLLAMTLAGLVFLVVGVGAVLLLGVSLSGIVVGRVERRRLRLMDPDPLPDPHRPCGRTRRARLAGHPAARARHLA